jgi:hypothetical protein
MESVSLMVEHRCFLFDELARHLNKDEYEYDAIYDNDKGVHHECINALAK